MIKSINSLKANMDVKSDIPDKKKKSRRWCSFVLFLLDKWLSSTASISTMGQATKKFLFHYLLVLKKLYFWDCDLRFLSDAYQTYSFVSASGAKSKFEGMRTRNSWMALTNLIEFYIGFYKEIFTHM